MAAKADQNQQEEVAIPMPVSPSKNDQSPKMGSLPPQCSSPAISEVSPSPNKTPKYPSESPSMQHKTTKAKPKSRFGEPSVPIDSQTMETLDSLRCNLPELGQQDPLSTGTTSSKEGDKEPDEQEIYHRVTAQLSARNTRRLAMKFLFQLVVFLLILGCLVSSLTIRRLKNKVFLGLEGWKWFLLLMVIFSCMLVTHWVVHLIVFLIEWKFLLKKNVVYFTHGLKKNVEEVICISLVLATWVVLLKSHVETTPRIEKILDFVTRTLVSLLVGSYIWLIKTTLIKVLGSSFPLNRFFDRIQEAIFHHYVLQTLSGRPVVELASKNNKGVTIGQVRFTKHTNNHKEKKVFDLGKLHKMKKEKVPSWTMNLLVDVMLNSGLSTMSEMIDKDFVEGGVELDDDEITSEEEAITTAYRIFKNITKNKDGQNYIDESDLDRFMIKEEVELLYRLFEDNDKRQISLKAFRDWVVKVYKDRQALQHALNDNKTAIRQLDKLLTGILIVLIIILWLLLTEIATTKVLLFIASQVVMAVFVFGNTCKTIFEAIIFVFVMHPFDVGDRCIIDESVMLVEEMNILTTVFLKADKEKLYYPNSVLATKAIGNNSRSPYQGDSLEFSIDYTTPLSKIGQVKDRIK